MANQINFSDAERHAGSAFKALIILVIVLVVGWALSQVYVSVPAGHVAVASLFGDVRKTPYKPGLHFPVNPLYRFTQYDARLKTHMEQAGVPSQDQLTTKVDVSVQYRLIGDMAPMILSDTGTAEQMLEVHLVPKVRSLLREQGKSIERAEDFFNKETQERLQTDLKIGLEEYLNERGIAVQEVLIRDITLPQRLISQIEQKKEAEQMAERQKAKLDQFRTEQEQKVAQAEAERKAASEEAERRKLIADAQAYEIEKINEAVANNPAYIKLEALKALQAISKDPAAKIYFMDGQSSMPLPLMHMGEMNTK